MEEWYREPHALSHGRAQSAEPHTLSYGQH